MKKRRKLKKKVVVLIVLIIILLLILTGIFVYSKTRKETNVTVKAEVVDKIPEYGYVLESNKTKLYRDLFKDLVKVLKEEQINEEEYAKTVAQMAVVDFYNLDNKASKNDIGGVQFIREKNKDNFILEASETVYKYIEQNLDGKRKQELPIVTKSEIVSVKKGKYSYKDIKDNDAYTVIVKLEYKKDLGYPKQVTVKLLHTDKKLEIYYMK